jgi:hypothetical protein
MMWPTVVAAVLLSMLGFMIIADPAAQLPSTTAAHAIN